MLTSVCSMRSAQCAALIALATAAGIVRVEPVRVGGSHAAPELFRPTAGEALSLAKPTRFHVAAEHQAPWMASFATLAAWCLSSPSSDPVSDPDVKRCAQIWLEVSEAPAGIEAPICSAFGRCVTAPGKAPSSREHHFPYAVGPPRRDGQLPLRAEGTYVPSDSAARRSLRIAASFPAFGCAREARDPLPGAESAGPTYFPTRVSPCAVSGWRSAWQMLAPVVLAQVARPRVSIRGLESHQASAPEQLSISKIPCERLI